MAGHILLAKTKGVPAMRIMTLKAPKIVSTIIRLFTKNKNR